MQLYDIKVRLGGSVLNEVRKTNVTAPEVLILRGIHGSDAVVDITEGKMDKRAHAEERERLVRIYASKEENSPEDHSRKIGMLRTLFGHDLSGLPSKLPESYPKTPILPNPPPTVESALA